MRVAVAGSSGLVGSALVPELRQAGHEVVRLVRRPPRAADEREWDPPAGRIDEGALDGVDAVVNLSGAGVGDRRWTHARKQVLLDSRIEPTEVLAGAVAERGIGVLVNASGVHFYGDGGDRVLDEAAPRGRGFLSDLCRDWEAATQRARDAGSRVVLARFGHVLAGGGLLGRLRPIFRLGLGGRLGRGDQYVPWIHRADHVAAIRFVLEHGSISGPVNLCAPHPVTNIELTRALSRALRRPAPWAVPRVALRVVVGELADEMLMSQRAVPKVLADNGFEFRYSKLEDALAELEASGVGSQT
ncbi:MAG TPA: TIGR01777 family oxidoreductase [Actinophytocola sp.]|uniref:TIGR01777 family oxidoreductase n=1 Tax=Actinophytocola sp. TaxID=1872138 RepID=UPI002DDD01C8|nr:TIGR01777 family oxidoreductase [Actinophytocola sp.]HEV2780753.1 TIGR01777 family oxidoreductase [Actinophytocola sp.]